MALAQVFHALGDPVRLTIVERLTTDQPCTIAAVCDGLDITRQGVRKHLQVLENAHLVRLEVRGRESLVSLERDTFEDAKAYIAKIERTWDARLAGLKASVENR